MLSNGGLCSDRFLVENTASAAPSTWKKEGRRCPDVLVSLFGRGELRSKPNERLMNQKDSFYFQMYSIERHLRWTLEGKREKKKGERKEKRPWPKKIDLWFLVLCLLYYTA